MSRTADGNVFTDFSGLSTSASGNPYDGLLEACNNEPVRLYSTRPDLELK